MLSELCWQWLTFFFKNRIFLFYFKSFRQVCLKQSKQSWSDKWLAADSAWKIQCELFQRKLKKLDSVKRKGFLNTSSNSFTNGSALDYSNKCSAIRIKKPLEKKCCTCTGFSFKLTSAYCMCAHSQGIRAELRLQQPPPLQEEHGDVEGVHIRIRRSSAGHEFP